MYWKRDYGHVIPVDGNLTRTFPYSQTTLQSGDFGAPFLKCLVKVPDHRFYQLAAAPETAPLTVVGDLKDSKARPR